MLIAVAAPDRSTLLGSLASVLTSSGRAPLSDAGAESILAFSRHALGDTEAVELDALALPEPDQLARAIPDGGARDLVAEALAIAALVDGELDSARIDLVLAYAAALEISAHWVEDLALSRATDLNPVIADMGARNLESVTDGRLDLAGIDDVSAWLLPYSGHGADDELAHRYRSLASLPKKSFGHAFFAFYDRHGFAMPGEPGAVNEIFGTPHDATHLLSGYDTSPQGELLVSTFTSQMHPVHPFEGHVLPVIYSWHLGIEFNKLAGSYRGAFDAAKFWVAWERGAHAHADTFRADFDFWEHVSAPLADVALAFDIPPLDDHFAAHSDAVAGVDYHPIA